MARDREDNEQSRTGKPALSNGRVALLSVPGEGVFSPLQNSPLPPLSMGILKGYLSRKGFCVELFDLNAKLRQVITQEAKVDLELFYHSEPIIDYITNGKSNSIVKIIEQIISDIPIENFDLIGISLGGDLSFFQIHSGLCIGRYIQDRTDVPLVFGGGNIGFICQYPNIFQPLFSAAMKQFDFIIRGPGERSIELLLGYLLESRDIENLKQIPGLLRMNELGTPVWNKLENPQLPCPDFDGLDMNDYSNWLLKEDPTTTNETESENCQHLHSSSFVVNALNLVRKGDPKQEQYEKVLIIPYIFNYFCPYRCAFCSESHADPNDSKRRVLVQEAETVVNDIKRLSIKYKTKHFIFFNNAINNNPGMMDEFCRRLIEADINIFWSDCARFTNMTEQRLVNLKKAGCQRLVFGFETAGESLLKKIDKKLDLNHAELVLQWCQQVGIRAELEVIVGLPGETPEDFQATYDFCLRNQNKVSALWCQRYFLLPESRIGEMPELYGIKILKEAKTYDSLLEENRRWFNNKSFNAPFPVNCNIYGFNHMEGPSWEEWEAIAKGRYETIDSLNRKMHQKFAGVFQDLLQAFTPENTRGDLEEAKPPSPLASFNSGGPISKASPPGDTDAPSVMKYLKY